MGFNSGFKGLIKIRLNNTLLTTHRSVRRDFHISFSKKVSKDYSYLSDVIHDAYSPQWWNFHFQWMRENAICFITHISLHPPDFCHTDRNICDVEIKFKFSFFQILVFQVWNRLFRLYWWRIIPSIWNLNANITFLCYCPVQRHKICYMYSHLYITPAPKLRWRDINEIISKTNNLTRMQYEFFVVV